jgi:hypothetical protein
VRICILTKADTLSWTQHYVDAFRQRAEVITVGPGYDTKQIEDWDLGDLADTLVPNDIETPLDPDQNLRAILPDGWNPDLIVAIANGGVALQPSMDGLTCPTAYITVDTWQSISDYVECQQYDFVFAAQRTAVDHLKAVGGSNVFWLPLGCNPEAHYPIDLPRDHDVSFAGSVALPVHQNRYDLLQRLENRVSLHIATKVFRDELCQAMARGRLVFNQSAVNEINMRVFEVMAMGRPLLTNREAEINGLSDLFVDGEHLIVYDDANDLDKKVRYYLDHEDEREAIAHAGHQLAITQHRYLDRVDTLLTTIGERVPSFREGQTLTATAITDPLADFVPFGAKRVIDIGNTLEKHITALKYRGVEEWVGVGNSDTAVSADIVAVHSTDSLEGDILATLDRSYGMLVSGGTLIIRLASRDFSQATGITGLSQLEDAFAKHGFHVTGCNVEGANVIVRARKRERRLADVVEESHAQLPHVDREGLARWAAVYGPNF